MIGGERATALLLLQKFGQFAPRQDKKFVFPTRAITPYTTLLLPSVTASWCADTNFRHFSYEHRGPRGQRGRDGLDAYSMSPSLFRAMSSALSVCSAILLPAAGVCAVLAAEKLEAGDRIRSGCSSCRIVKQFPLHASLSLSNTRVIRNTRTLSPLTGVSHLSQMSFNMAVHESTRLSVPACL